MKRTLEDVILSLLVLVLLSAQGCQQSSQSQSKPTNGSGPNNNSAAVLHEGPAAKKEDLPNWQTISVSGEAIRFKLPPGWRSNGSGDEFKTENFTIKEVAWNSPNGESIRITINIYPKGFKTALGEIVSKEGMLEEDFNAEVKLNTEEPSRNPSYNELKKMKLGGVDGVYRLMQTDASSEDGGPKKGIIWTGYRAHEGNAQRVNISVTGSLSSEQLLRTVFNTLEIE